jgi:endonuclease/exonuclease/phosphatase (EEP) superfamily protein YafD
MKPTFTLRDLFWLVALVAVTLGWLRDRTWLQATVAHTHGSWVIAVGDLPLAEGEAVRQRQKKAYDHLHYGARNSP